MNVEASASNSDKRTFREKSFGIPKAFAKIKWCVGAKFFGLPFSERKVSYALYTLAAVSPP